MGMCPEEMERWGTASILKESARLLRKHYRLFLPFILAFYIPSSIAPGFETTIQPLPGASVAVNTAQAPNPPGNQSIRTIFSWTFVLLMFVLGTLGTAAVSYITAHLYTPTDTDVDDRSIVPKVFKFLPHAFLRMFITRLWAGLAVFFLYVSVVVVVSLVFILDKILATNWLGSKLKVITLLLIFLTFAGIIFLAIVFALAQVVAALEPGNYGRKALKRSMKLARIGRVGTIVAVALLWNVLNAVLSVLAQGILTGGMPVWAKTVSLAIVIGGVGSVFRVYFGVVWVVMYFAYKARFDAAESAGIPVFKRIDSADHSYVPIVEGKGSVTYIGEP